jgi:hypothetical protein
MNAIVKMNCSCDHGFKYVNTEHYVTLLFNVHVDSVKQNDELIYCRNVKQNDELIY